MLRCRVILGIVAGVLTESASVSAAPLIDQSYLANPVQWGAPVHQSSTLGQTFVAEQSGRLQAVEVQIGRAAWDRFENLFLEIRTVSDGRPGLDAAAVLATFEIDWSEVPPYAFDATEPLFTRVDVSSAELNVKAGEALAIVLRSPEPAYFRFYNWSASPLSAEPGYAAGTLFQLQPDLAWDTDRDAGFRTYVNPVPEPAVGLVWVGAICAWTLRRRLARR